MVFRHGPRPSWATPAVIVFLAGAVCVQQDAAPASGQGLDPVTLSIVGTSDLHGRIETTDGHGGLTLLGGFLQNLRLARAADGGEVILLDAGDTFQGGLASNLSEGAVVVDAYNALGYSAAAIGNHEFEFGAVDGHVSAADGPADHRGALKARAEQAHYPFLAANLVDERTGQLVDWPNVYPSVMVEAGGVAVGIIGVMTYDGLSKTLAANVQGLRLEPLEPTITAEASRLRRDGADVVIVTAHAGGRCERFDVPDDLESCDDTSEIFRVARELPRGLVDAIVAGHTHAGLAHTVAGIPIIEAYSAGRAFGRVDLTFDRRTGRVSNARLFAPQPVCAFVNSLTGECATRPGAPASRQATYEGREVEAAEEITAAMEPALERVRLLRQTPLGVMLDTELSRAQDQPESALGNLFADALRAAIPEATVALSMGARRGGLRADLPAGPLTLGAVYDAFPFDNRVVSLQLTGEQLRQALQADVSRSGRRSTLAVSGMEVRVGCAGGEPRIELYHSTGEPIGPNEALVVATTDFIVARSALVSGLARVEATELPDAPLVREAVARWLSVRGGRMHNLEFFVPDRQRWQYRDGSTCLV